MQGQAALVDKLMDREQVVPGVVASDVRVQVGSDQSPSAADENHSTLYSETGNFEMVGDEYSGKGICKVPVQ